ncbi:MAG: phosphotransferase family protein [Kiloniellales bacterium]
MKRHWPRQQPLLSLDTAQATRLLRPLDRDIAVVEVTPLASGLINTNLRVRLAGQADPLLLRLYRRGAAEARKEAAIARLLQGRVPAARVLHVAGHNPVTGHAYAVFEWIEGECFDLVLPTLDDTALDRLGQAIGRVLAAIHGIYFDRYGFLADDLSLAEAIDVDGKGVLAFVRRCLSEGPARARLGEALAVQLIVFMESESAAVDGWLPPPCLVHGDFNPANLLVRRDASSGEWMLAAVLDWEFALAATPAFDFGNLLRPPLGQQGGFVQALAAGYRAAGGQLPDGWQRIARLVDLTAWTEMLSRPNCADAVIADARSIIRATVADDLREDI